MAWNNPLALDRVLDVVRSRAPLAPGDLVVDVGCGTGELLAALVSGGVRGFGVDLSEEAITSARALLPGTELVRADAREATLPTGAALAVCLGSTHALGGLAETCAALRAIVAPSGAALIGEGFQRRPLDPGYAALLGTPTGIERTHLDNVLEMEKHGWTCEHAITASEAEWDAFEWAFFRRRGDRRWRDAWLRWGRDTMGFGAYLLRAQASAGSQARLT